MKKIVILFLVILISNITSAKACEIKFGEATYGCFCHPNINKTVGASFLFPCEPKYKGHVIIYPYTTVQSTCPHFGFMGMKILPPDKQHPLPKEPQPTFEQKPTYKK